MFSNGRWWAEGGLNVRTGWVGVQMVGTGWCFLREHRIGRWWAGGACRWADCGNRVGWGWVVCGGLR